MLTLWVEGLTLKSYVYSKASAGSKAAAASDASQTSMRLMTDSLIPLQAGADGLVQLLLGLV